MVVIGGLKKETEGFLTAIQYQSLRINAKVKIDKQEGDVACSMCKDREETIAPLNQ